MRLFTHSRTAGLACCDGHITLVCILHKRHGISCLEAIASTPLPDTPEAVTDAIRDLVTLTQSRGWPAAIALPTEKIIRREILMSGGQSPAERETELHEHLADYLPGCPPMVCLDYICVSREQNVERILLVAAEKSTVQRAVAPVENAGLVVRVVDITLYAKERALTLKPLHQLPCSAAVDKTLLDHPTACLLTALGLALRRCPVW